MKKLLLLLVANTALYLPAQQPQPAPPAQETQQPASSTAAPPVQSVSHRPPQAKTQQEYNDYNAAYAVTGGAAMEKAADDFATKYPDSELRAFLYSKAMHEYQNENNSGKMLAMGEKVLSLDPDNTIALVLTATVLSDNLSDADQDRQQKIAEIKKNATRALQTVDTSFIPPAGATQDQIAGYKNTLRAMARTALGITELKNNEDLLAENDLKAAADLNPAQPDPYVWYHLALAQDHQMKYAEALASVNKALEYASSNPELARLAQGEQDRLSKLVNATAMPAPGPTQPQPTTKPPQ